MGKDLLSELKTLPIIVILRGVSPKDVVAIGESLAQEGVRCIEIPFTSSMAAESIHLLSERPGIMVGAGTVVKKSQADACLKAGGTYALAPNVSATIIHHARAIGLSFIPGFFTPSEAFAALDAGAEILKFFPAGEVNNSYLKSMLPLLPPATPIIATGSLTPQRAREYLDIGVVAVALGGAVYQPGDSADSVSNKIAPFIKALT